MEVYAPIPGETLRHAPRALCVLGALLVSIGLAFAVVPVVRYTFQLSQPPDFYNFGAVHTPLGDAVVACGGEVSSGCGNTTALAFVSCSEPIRAYFTGVYDPQGLDAHVRRLIGKRAPSGTTWTWNCGSSGLRRDRLAQLQPA